MVDMIVGSCIATMAVQISETKEGTISQVTYMSYLEFPETQSGFRIIESWYIYQEVHQGEYVGQVQKEDLLTVHSYACVPSFLQDLMEGLCTFNLYQLLLSPSHLIIIITI